MNEMFLVFVLLGGTAAGGAANAGRAATSHGSGAGPAAVFQKHCAVCHGAEGAGKTPMGKAVNAADLRSNRIQGQSDAMLTHFIAAGEGQMPAFRNVLTHREILEQARYIHALAKKSGTP